uniref:DUF932 domain-containing protein n=1 Tax=viral metagenome TaxID=1070528 RepID=A0A6M3ITB7_9ZZZZ
MFKEERNSFFKIRKENVTTDSGIIINNRVALVNDDTNDVIGFVSKGYEVVSNEMVADIWDRALSGLKIAKTIDHLDATTKRWKRHVVFADDELNFTVKGDDTVGVLLQLFNGYDGRTAFGFELMGYRWMCENGIVTGKKRLLSGTFAHYSDNPEKFRQSVETRWPLFRQLADTWKEWTQIPFDFSKFNEFVDSKSYVSPKVKESIKSLYPMILDRQKMEDNKWGAFNVLTYLSTHETKARKGSNVFSNRYKVINRLAEDMYDERI